tara:strand:+ start:63006 stop:63776 length:771 start_codon:yes stop_codon:yes gene_type:complete
MNKIRVIKSFTLSAIILFSVSCGDNLTPYESTNYAQVSTVKKHGNTEKSAHVTATSAVKDGVHIVKLKEVLPTTKYVYLLVEENNEEFWIATIKREVTVGNTYMFTNGLVKTNFESKEHNRVFDTILLVSNLIDSDHSKHSTQKAPVEEITKVSGANVVVKNSVRIGDLVASASKYANKKIQVSGVVTKINAKIMKRNWVHLDDGSNDGFDLIITTNETLELGATVTMTGIVATHKDYGAGYKFDVILEEGQVVTN